MTENKKVELSAVLEEETMLIKANFKGNESLLKAMRNLFFGFELTEIEKNQIRSTFTNSKLKEVVRKKILPMFEDTKELGIGLAADFWLDVEKEILGAGIQAIEQRIRSKQMVFEMVNKAIGLLENPDDSMKLQYQPDMALDPLQIGLLARSLYIRTIGQGLSLIKLIADQEDKTAEKIEETRKKDSTK